MTTASPERSSALTPVNRRKLSSDVTSALRQAILTGSYQPGDHLTEAQIAQEMHVSHGPVREALRELAAEELIVLEPHRGAYVKTFTADDVREIYSMRMVLESAMVRLTIEHASEDELDGLDAIIADMRSAAREEESDALIELDLEFHRRLCELSGHRRLFEAWQRLASPIRLFLAMAIPRYLGLVEAAESHPPIMRAIRRRDAEAAIKFMDRGVLQIGESISIAMAAQAPPEPQ